MNIHAFKSKLVISLQKFFPEANITTVEKRSIILEMRVDISEHRFLEIYYNAFTNKKCYSLVSDNERIFGYDNYKYWHLHPADNPIKHVPCPEPSMEEVFSQIKGILSKS